MRILKRLPLCIAIVINESFNTFSLGKTEQRSRNRIKPTRIGHKGHRSYDGLQIKSTCRLPGFPIIVSVGSWVWVAPKREMSIQLLEGSIDCRYLGIFFRQIWTRDCKILGAKNPQYGAEIVILDYLSNNLRKLSLEIS